MNTNYQMWITYNAEKEKMRIPVLPEKFDVSIGSNNSNVDVAGLGEIVIRQARPAFQFSFSSFFPKTAFPGVSTSLSSPLDYINKLKEWQDGEKPVHLILTNIGIDEYCTIEKLSYYEEGGDIGTIHYDLTLKEYREVTVQTVTISTPKVTTTTTTTTTKKATVTKTETRVDNSTTSQTYTVKSGDCLWNIAKKFYGNGSKYTVIYNANKSVIGGNPNLIYAGQVLTIPSE